ncbi:glycosyltransferase family 39 protein [Thermodesulfovibrio sp. 3907-1M]|uniref:Glycosyltransferase family 39 protein n=1 Tax=Thermodesulfovibrio autotrophicus TaxID=3118333 RepID=A0AAU8GW89_9BACT
MPVFLLMIYRYFKAKNYIEILYLITAITLVVFISDWFSLEIKNLVQRVRPCHTEYFRGVVGCTASYSFPSNHATNSLAVATVLILFGRKLWKSKLISIYIISVALFICLSRLYLGVHWLTDVLGGALLGLIIGYGVFNATLSVNNLKRFFYFFLIILSLFRVYFILHGPLDLSPDEAHYWEWSRRLDLSYYSKGPVIAYLIAFSTWLFGDNPFGVRIFAVLCSFLSSFFVYKIGKKLFDEKTGYISGVLFQLIPLFSTFGILFTIDSPFILFWIVSMYLFILTIEKRGYWLVLGFFIGLGLLTKYTMAFFYFCMITYLLGKRKNAVSEHPMFFTMSSRGGQCPEGSLIKKKTLHPSINFIRSFTLILSLNGREILKNPWLYVCVIISLLVFSPVIIWNAQHDWVTIKHTAGQAHLYDGLKISLKYFAEFIGSQLIVVTPLIFALGFYFLLKPSTLSLKPDTRWFLTSFSMPVLVFFLLKSIQGKVQANWAMPAYLPFLIVIAFAFARRLYKKLVLSAILIAVVFTIFSHALPYLNLPEKIDPSARLKGWRELGIKVSEMREELEKTGKVVIFSDRYQISSELAFYTKGNPFVYCINLGRRMNQYDLWQSKTLEINGTVHGVYVVYGMRNTPEPDVSSAFEHCDSEHFTVYKKRVKIRDYTIFRCYNFKGMEINLPESY